jgi:uncharacterized protein YndB with AHSA1/START domain
VYQVQVWLIGLLLPGGACLLSIAGILAFHEKQSGVISEVDVDRVNRLSLAGLVLIYAAPVDYALLLSPLNALIQVSLPAAWFAYWLPRRRRQHHIASSIFIAASPEEVFRWISDPALSPIYTEGVESAVVVTAGPIAAGSVAKAVVNRDGRRLTALTQIVGFEPGQRLVSSVISGRRPNLFTYTLEPTIGGTNVISVYDQTMPMVDALLGMALFQKPGMDRRMQEQRAKTLAGLKYAVETDTDGSAMSFAV